MRRRLEDGNRVRGDEGNRPQAIPRRLILPCHLVPRGTGDISVRITRILRSYSHCPYFLGAQRRTTEVTFRADDVPTIPGKDENQALLIPAPLSPSPSPSLLTTGPEVTPPVEGATPEEAYTYWRFLFDLLPQ